MTDCFRDLLRSKAIRHQALVDKLQTMNRFIPGTRIRSPYYEQQQAEAQRLHAECCRMLELQNSQSPV